MTLEQINAKIAEAKAAGVIYNAEYVDLKARLGRLIENAKSEANGVYLKNRPADSRDYGNANLDKMYWANIGVHSLKTLQNAVLAVKPKNAAEWDTLRPYAQIVLHFADTAVDLLALKSLIVKGRRPSANQIERKERAEKCKKVIAALNVALVGFRKYYREAYIAAFQNRLNSLHTALAKNGLDLNKVHPYPNYNLPKKVFAQAKADYSWSRAVTESLPSMKNDMRPSSPYYAQVKASAFETARKEAISAADASINGYIHKLAGKIGPGDYSIKYLGNLWGGSDVHVLEGDQVVQTWHTKCILNVSCLGTVFNQWPTRRVS